MQLARSSWFRVLKVAVGSTLVGFHLYTGIFGLLDAYQQRIVHLSLGLTMACLLMAEGMRRRKDALTRALFVGSCIGVIAFTLYVFAEYDWLTFQRRLFLTPLRRLELIGGLSIIVGILMLVTRIVSPALAAIGIAFFLYPICSSYMPGLFASTSIGWSAWIDYLILTPNGILGMPLGVSATQVAPMIIFAVVVGSAGLRDLLGELALSLFARAKGGAAKAAIVASTFIGMITGSSTANVVTTGTVTIPLMMRAGFRPELAAAIEAATSVGSQFMPPVMGATAFVMSALTGIPYSRLMLYALIPAILYFLSLFLVVQFESERIGGVNELPAAVNLRRRLRESGFTLVPVIVLITLLGTGYTPGYAAAVASIVAMILTLTFKRLRWQWLIDACYEAARSMLVIIGSTGVAGIIVASVEITGLGLRLSSFISDVGGGNLVWVLSLTMVASLLLGLGMPTTPAYIVLASVVIPTLIDLGLGTHVAHLFAFYFATLALITPPDASAAFAAASIAGGEPMRTGWLALRLSIPGFLIPFAFAFNHGLLLEGSVSTILAHIAAACGSVFCIAVMNVGRLRGECTVIERALAGLIGVLFIVPSWIVKIVAALILTGMIVVHLWRHPLERASVNVVGSYK